MALAAAASRASPDHDQRRGQRRWINANEATQDGAPFSPRRPVSSRSHGTELAVVANTRTRRRLGNFPLHVQQHAPRWRQARFSFRDGPPVPFSRWQPIGELQAGSANDERRSWSVPNPTVPPRRFRARPAPALHQLGLPGGRRRPIRARAASAVYCAPDRRHYAIIAGL
jgi:hypothetical protein